MKTRTTALILPALLFLLTGCGRETKSSGPTEETRQPMTVQAKEVRYREFSLPEAVPGQVRPAHFAVLSARVQGTVSEIAAIPGQQVDEGEVLAELSSRELEARVRRAEAEMEAATLEMSRVSNLMESRAATRQELEAAEARHRSAQAALDEALAFLGYTTVKAPFAGQIARKLVEAGDLVSPGQPILELFAPDLYRLEAHVPESLAASLEVGATLPFKIAGTTGSGQVAEIDPASDPASRTVLVKLDLPDDPALRMGQYGRLLVPASTTRAILVPPSAVLTRGQLEYVFIVSENRAHLRLVRTGSRPDALVEILAGLAEGDIVVTEPTSALRDGHPVEIVR